MRHPFLGCPWVHKDKRLAVLLLNLYTAASAFLFPLPPSVAYYERMVLRRGGARVS